jgi:hypothetical protein
MAWIVLGASAVLAAALLVLLLPYWAEYRFYNWEMSVLRKPAYTVRALVDRVSWLPLVQGTFARMWPVLVAAALGCVAVVLRWREARPAERLLVWWLVIGLAELAVHDSGNERRYLMFVPLMIALGTIFLTTRPSAPAAATQTSTGWPERVAALGLTAALAYLVAGSGMRLLLAERVTGGDLSLSVRVAAAASISLAIAAAWRWRTVVWALRARARPSALLPALALLGIAWNVPDYLDWMAHRGSVNYDASVAVGRLLPPGTLVQGKLANGLALENTIRPLFVGNGFGNYADRFVRDDAGYILTYDLPRIGFESSDGSELIQQILDRYPRRTVVAAFPVDETPEPERAVLIDKMPDR